MDELEIALEISKRSEAAFLSAIREEYPRAERWTWYRAIEAVKTGAADKYDVMMAENERILVAHDQWIKDLQAFYLLRDGQHGFLGGKEF